ncbi:MAG: ATP-binding protein [Deltaproteobacteria bacterium]|jgi:hypothetical protein|nr:ATP-binding protein [Deltaproteobacteria bacterium]
MTVKIAFSGAHGTGKTEAADMLAAWFERRGTPVVRIPSAARICPYPVNRDATAEAQRWIWHRHALEEMDAEREARARGGVVICDRTLADCLVYSEWHGREGVPGGDWDWVEGAQAVFTGTDLDGYSLIFLTEPRGPAPADGFRDPGGEWRDVVAAFFRGWWDYVRGLREGTGLAGPPILAYEGPEQAAREAGRLACRNGRG